MTVIQSEHFATEVDGLADAPAKLASLNRFDDQEVNVISAIYLDINGVITEMEIGVAGGTQSRKFPANALFKDAPEGSRLRLRRFNFAQFKFPPGQCYSEWVGSENIDWSVMRSNNMKEGEYPVNNYKDIGVGPFVSRLHVTTFENANTATVWLVAIPRQDIENLPGTATGMASEGYPVILVGEFPAIMAGEHEEVRRDGLPFYPVCINRGPVDGNITIPTSKFLRRGMSAFWSNTTEPNCLAVTEWTTAARGPQEPDQTVVRAEWIWPDCSSINEEEGDEDSGGGRGDGGGGGGGRDEGGHSGQRGGGEEGRGHSGQSEGGNGHSVVEREEVEFVVE